MTEVINLISDEEAEAESRIATSNRSAAPELESRSDVAHDRSRVGGISGREDLRAALTRLDAEIKSVQEQLHPLWQLHASLLSERRQLESQLSNLSHSNISSSSKSNDHGKDGIIDYQKSDQPWSDTVQGVLQSRFGLSTFRLCQEGVINAAIDGRDIVCVMPTGGGKSLTYQLPAVIGSKGLTVVISPLLALIWDQVRALKELGIESAMLIGSTSKEEQNAIYKRIEGSHDGARELKPEKIAKSKRLKSVLEKANAGGRLKRFVIDEAHCCSQLGHDFRPDYQRLNVLKTLFPRVPIQAVTATLSSKTLPDLLKILRLPPICDGRAANKTGTVFFSAPLFRSNLHYQVLPKPSNAKAAIEKIGSWIQLHHPGESGIIYCFSKKDADTVAESLKEWSNGEIKTGVYHAGIEDWEKEKIHVKWRKGRINCICATIAFGLGIDKGDVRYVIHHSLSKSLEGYYQETGRAGRDGQKSDCVLFYRGQDASRLATMVYSDVDGLGKLQEMIKFAQDLLTCRKIAFAKYFSASSHLSAAAWDHSDTLGASGGTVSTCGICDNCIRDPTSIITKDVTLDAWKCLKVLQNVSSNEGRVTLANLVELVRGLGGGAFGTMKQGKRGARKSSGEKASLDLESVAGGKVTLSKDDVETLLVHLSTMGYVSEYFAGTAYSVNVYVQPGPRAIRLTRLSAEDVEAGLAAEIECTFLNLKARVVKRKATSKKEGKKTLVDISDNDDKNENVPQDEDGGQGLNDSNVIDDLDEVFDDDDDWDNEGWEVTKGAAGGRRPDKKAKMK
ncbi:P-loop containing nucleoside triphosphate hydrolase protein [Kockovaella imperatae]|uniref:ATP-dependent DNA helicase n=1 Tax=Kockovaella imperatae TaxID=4999 RepID=A0A1Y1U8T6_9TREE|nr:P-loop containing nucleoside triphosphate hydrolase protein [Kockovaella imperatae]ORX34459.1 P-loop containing nucleoside triphosphate hydrolase protein [Kockovaella imperatae]